MFAMFGLQISHPYAGIGRDWKPPHFSFVDVISNNLGQKYLFAPINRNCSLLYAAVLIIGFDLGQIFCHNLSLFPRATQSAGILVYIFSSHLSCCLLSTSASLLFLCCVFVFSLDGVEDLDC